MLPNFIVIGALRCGTTSLYWYLNYHFEISMSKPKELNFFIDCPKEKLHSNWHKGIRWYGSHFDAKAKIRGEVSPLYTAYPFDKGVAKRMHSVVPNAKLIYILRNPIDRIVSNWAQNYEEGREVVKLPERYFIPHYVETSRYFDRLKDFLEFFSYENILIVTLEELNEHPMSTMKNIFAFVGAKNPFYDVRFNRVHHSTVGKPILDKKSRHKMINLLKDNIDKLSTFTQKDFSGWLS